MSGFYNNWFKVQNPNAPCDITPMESGGFQAPFYFGGSNVPSALKLNLHKIEDGGYSKTSFRPELRGKNVAPVYHHKHSNIHIPRHMGSL